MKADFEKGTKICSKCKRRLPISEFYKDARKDGKTRSVCKCCHKQYVKERYRSDERYRRIIEKSNRKRNSVFKRKGIERGNHGMLKRDYELSEQELKKEIE